MAGEFPVRYRSPDEDSGRWTGFAFRDGDIVISTRSKSGTTWVQMICALLVFQTPDLPRPLAELSPWLDWLVEPQDQVYERLAAQTHRRFIKSHTPLDGIPLDARVTYIVVGRHPLDMAVSLYHQGSNLDRAVIAARTGQPPPDPAAVTRSPLGEWLRAWIETTSDPRQRLDSLPGVLWHLSDAWSRRRDPNIVLVHYQDLVDDLEAEMRTIAVRLGVVVSEVKWPELVQAATFSSMRDQAEMLAPDPIGVLKDRGAFFRQGRSGQYRDLLSNDDLARYLTHAAKLAPPDLLSWLHRV